MFIVYVLYSNKYDKIYVGYTSNLEERLSAHNIFSKKGYTIKFRPWEVIYSEEHKTKKEAMLREKQLKSATGRKFIRKIVTGKF